MKRKLIIAIVGPSGSGKTTLGRYMRKVLGYNWICSYTTRSMRPGEVDGVDHRFVSVDEMPDRSDMMAYTLFGGNHYWTTFDQFEDIPNVYVVDEKGLVEMERMIADNEMEGYDILKVYVKRNGIDVGEERMKRDDERDVLPECYYDIVIDNDSDLESFLADSVKEISQVVDLIIQ